MTSAVGRRLKDPALLARVRPAREQPDSDTWRSRRTPQLPVGVKDTTSKPCAAPECRNGALGYGRASLTPTMTGPEAASRRLWSAEPCLPCFTLSQPTEVVGTDELVAGGKVPIPFESTTGCWSGPVGVWSARARQSVAVEHPSASTSRIGAPPTVGSSSDDQDRPPSWVARMTPCVVPIEMAE